MKSPACPRPGCGNFTLETIGRTGEPRADAMAPGSSGMSITATPTQFRLEADKPT